MLASHFRTTLWVELVGGATAVPVTGTLILVPFVALLVMVIEPERVPATLGAKSTLTVAVCPGSMVVPALTPVCVNPVPALLIPETEIFEFPAFFSVISLTDEAFTSTSPKATLDGATSNSLALASPVPDKGTATSLVPPLSVTVIVPETLPAETGKKATVNCTVEPSRRVVGVLIPEIEKPLPVAVMLEINTFLPSSFFNWTIRELRVPTDTFPNAALVGTAVKVPADIVRCGLPARSSTATATKKS